MQLQLDVSANAILAAFSAPLQQRLLPHPERVACLQGQWLYDSQDKLRYVYFPIDAVVCLLCVMSNSKTTALSLIGQEGVVGSTIVLGAKVSQHRALVQQTGYAYRLPNGLLKEAFEQDKAAQQLLLRYLHSQLLQIAQSAACYRHHYLEQQVCRWLLSSLDRVSGSRLYLTQEFIASLLGVRREGVTLVAGKLQQLKVIEYKRGHICVLNRPSLEQISCECYHIVTAGVAKI